jgi:hypothetical protein
VLSTASRRQKLISLNPPLLGNLPQSVLINIHSFLRRGASGGLLVGWNGAVFTGEVLYSSKFAIMVLLTANHNAEKWKLTNIYGPCQGSDRQDFVSWLNSTLIQDDENWLFVGDFNFYRSLESRNRDGGNMQDIIVFNSIISNLGLQEIPLKGRKFTWSNMHQQPLLEQLDWCFTSIN